MRAHFPAALIATSFLLALLPAAPAIADPSATPRPISSPNLSPNLSPMEQYKVELDLYLAKIKAREVEMKLLNQNFKAAIEKARRDYLTALRSAKGPTDKSLFSAKFDEVKSNATALLEEARENLGPMPTPPPEPAKGMKSKMSRENQKNKLR